jgi:TolB-like protein
MSSIIEGYNYDIFISYRQKDNKHDGWVTEFVDNLKGELESAFKEEVGVYFDINPHDGLLETHDVDASLKDKLKCLVFIPIISRTYCDPKSFAWEHEFKTFVEQASHDQFGLKVKLPNGNVTIRVLPVRIYDLDNNDIKLCESILDSVLRGVEFIYKELGVNRPLKPDDDEKINLNKTKYRNQINKVANAIKDVITAIEQHEQKTEEVSKEASKPLSVPRKSNTTKIIAGSLILLALIVLGYFIIAKFVTPAKTIEKSVAVLPFFNDSPGNEDSSYISGIMSEILNNLSKIEELSVRPRTSVEKYKVTNRPPIRQIRRELNANFIVDGSGQKYGNTIRLTIQLINAEQDRQIWTESYKEELKDAKDIFAIQSKIAKAIASELKAIITPFEKQMIDKASTSNLKTYQLYQEGKEEHLKYWINNNNKASLTKAKEFYQGALQNDPKFALAYVGLAMEYWDKYHWESYLSENLLDSVLIFCDLALDYDKQLSDAYTVKGDYYSGINKNDQAMEEYDKAIKINPNDYRAFIGKAILSQNNDWCMAIFYANEAISIYRGPLLSSYLYTIGWAYGNIGFLEKAKDCFDEAFQLDGDSANYYRNLELIEIVLENIDNVHNYEEKAYAIDTNDAHTLWDLGEGHMFLGQYEKSLKYFKKWLGKYNALDEHRIFATHRIGWAYKQNGYKKEADYYFNEQINYCNKMIDLRRETYREYYDLAAVYATIGEKRMAFENLRIFSRKSYVAEWILSYLKHDPAFNSIRNESEFQQIVKDVETKYQAEHERVRKCLEEHGMFQKEL